MNWNRLFTLVLIGPVVRLLYPMRIIGMHRLPRGRPFILAIGPHSTEWESVVIASHLWRFDMRFFIKESYLNANGTRLERLTAKFMMLTDQIPVDRLSGRKIDQAINRAVVRLTRGISVLIYPEGTRYFDGLVHPGGTMAQRTAWRATQQRLQHNESSVDVYPVGISGFRWVQPNGKKWPRPFRMTEMMIGEPLRVSDYQPPEAVRMLMSQSALESRVAKGMIEPTLNYIAAHAATGRSDVRSEITES